MVRGLPGKTALMEVKEGAHTGVWEKRIQAEQMESAKALRQEAV